MKRSSSFDFSLSIPRSYQISLFCSIQFFLFWNFHKLLKTIYWNFLSPSMLVTVVAAVLSCWWRILLNKKSPTQWFDINIINPSKSYRHHLCSCKIFKKRKVAKVQMQNARMSWPATTRKVGQKRLWILEFVVK